MIPRGKQSVAEGQRNPVSTRPKTRDKWQLASIVGSLIPGSPATKCCRTPIPSRDGHRALVVAIERGQCGRCGYVGLMRCGNLWSCPICARKIAAKRGNELEAAAQVWRWNGNSIAHIVYTMAHTRKDSLPSLRKLHSDARRYMKSGKHGLRVGVGTVRAIEVTHGPNGWHLHCHELVFIPGRVSSFDIAELERKSKERWRQALTHFGGSCDNVHGVTAEMVTKNAASYISKTVWGAAGEISGAAEKSAKGKNRSITQILNAIGDSGDFFGKDAELFREYCAGMWGERQMAYSKGTRALLGLDEIELTDEELANEGEKGDTIAEIDLVVEWPMVLSNDMRGDLVRAADSGGSEAVYKIVLGLVVGDQADQAIEAAGNATRALQYVREYYLDS